MINKVTLFGNIGTKEYTLTKDGRPRCKLSVATNKEWLNAKAQKEKVTTWHNVNCYDNNAEKADKCSNIGNLIFIEGEISNIKYDDNGISRIYHSITAHEFYIISPIKVHDFYIISTEQVSDIDDLESIPF